MKFNKTTLLSLLAIPALAACASGYNYDNNNVSGSHVYLPQNDSYMNDDHSYTHCNSNVQNCNVNNKKISGEPYLGLGTVMPDGGILMKAKSPRSYGEAMDMAQTKCLNATGINIWEKKEWNDMYVVKYSCFNK